MTKKISICMIVKDEEKNLRRCLESLTPLLNRNYTELIIVDTGSSDNTIDIAKEYTNQVYFHEWSGNFSDMRNISLSYAVGDWIFIIDADEELETPEKLIALIESNNINNFKTIRIREKHLLSSEGKKCVTHIQERLFKNDGKFQYRGTIHNQPIYQHPVLNTDIWLKHYGYINDDKELMEKKFERTANMLRKELEREPENVYYRFQLARSYMMHGEYVVALEEITKAYKDMKSQDKELIVHRYYVFGEFARMALYAKKYKDVIEIGKEGIRYSENYLDLYYYIGHAYLDLKENEKGLEYLEKYFELYIKYNKNELDVSRFTAVEMYSLEETSFERTLNRVVSTIYKDPLMIGKNIDNYNRYLKETGNKILRYKVLSQLMIVDGNYSGLVDVYNSVESEQVYPFINYLETLKKDLSDKDKMEMEQLFSSLDGDFGLLNLIRLSNSPTKHLIDFINQYDIIKYSDDVIIEFVKYLINSNILYKFFKKLDNVTMKKIVKVLIDNENKIDYFINSLRTDFRFNDFQNNRIFLAIANVILLSEIEEIKIKPMNTIENLKDIFYKYIEKGIENINFRYNIDRIRLIYNTNENSEEKFLMIMYLYSIHQKNGNKSLALKYLKEAGEVYPYFATFLTMIVNSIKEEIKVEEVRDSFNYMKNQKSIKVLHGTIEIAGQMNTLVNGLNHLENVTATALDYYPSYLSYGNANLIDLMKLENKTAETQKILESAIDTFDIFHFHYNRSLLTNLSDIPLLKESNKKIFMHNWGSDVRLLSTAKKLTPYAKTKNENEAYIINQLEYLGNYIDDCIVGDAELYEYVKDFYKRVHFVRQALDISQYSPTPNFKFRKTKPVIVHAPTSSDFKGTNTVHAVIENLKLKYDIEYKLVKNMSHDEAKEIYRGADIIIDELHSLGHGILSLEVMAMEKPVITSISDFMSDFYPKEIPIVSANPDTLEEKVELLINDWEMRKELGIQGRKYVEKYHDHKKIALDLLNIYNA
ncbi:glycosyltransferase [Ureibacillus sp. GCM10028918]|uniref:glycosyltransferase n=1 Tax=Ureibacillus sp. GCM10028918 TaxID=3273429 RepID=UPI003610EF74